MALALRPLFVAVTWGAGGSTSAGSLQLADLCQRQLGLTTCLHLTCTNMKKRLIDEALTEAKAMGVRNILALRGDPPREEEYRLQEEDETQGEEESNEHFTWAIDLVRYIRRVHGDHFCIGVATYPEGHADESHPVDQNPKHDLPYLIDKTKAGADFLMTQLFYDEDAYIKFEKMLRNHESGVFQDIPIIPGLMPIQSYQILKRTTKLSHCKLPQKLLDRLDPIKGDDEAVKSVGVDFISEIVEDLKKLPSVGRRGFHFYTLNLEKAVGFILERCHLIPPSTPNLDLHDSSAIDDSPFLPNGDTHPTTNGVPITTITASHHRVDSTASQDQLTTSTNLSTSPPSRAKTLAISHGQTPAGREATWDDYPNFRFGDARSPAFGTPLTYSPYSLPVPPDQARTLWGEPTSPTDITALFTSHLAGAAPHQLPWSEGTLSPETALIHPQLHALNANYNWWTIASQPAVDAVPSTDPTHGWGPPGGFVFQKAFVEFFLPASAFHSLLLPHLRSEAVSPQIAFYAGNAAGAFISSETEKAVHVVTWGSFPGKEIATATMVEEVSFRQWVEEAFGRWGEWGRCVRGRESREFLRGVREGWWLVNVIGHGYRDGEGGELWDVLLEAGRRGEGGGG
jgi:methylenetetrahydrofolate reductase (NADPH)